ncbi:hypothetical protein Sme01_28020 [Sphaerisporangium melleum]|uniref:Uncharacterized protein n=1 Tax=Sphaerisporangium melleum TaxID=321316 RepID=A0A917QVW8_9ACTN|nr:hypothetical protein [Sphaerisporangium melleum]GGK70081.1 hypothetical protein GCM10007964_11330 [Sphaerisporangium melleum]GII70326.1 hypothetical protein Sme01_28020 [Sphaerisporangium melleum]
MAADDRLTDTAGSGDELARRLRDVYRRVAAARLSPEEKERFTRRFVVICDLAKHDLDHARVRLDAFLADLEAEIDTPGRRNIAECD